MTVSHVDYPPGRVGAVHHHAGFVLAYVLEGAVITKISGQGEEKTYETGQMFYEQPGATHEVSKNASQTAAGKAAGDDLREERLDADDARQGERSVDALRSRRQTQKPQNPQILDCLRVREFCIDRRRVYWLEFGPSTVTVTSAGVRSRPSWAKARSV